MTERDKAVVEETVVSCEVCLKEIPVAEATNVEAVDYFVHFCGLDCYEQWKKQRQPQKLNR